MLKENTASVSYHFVCEWVNADEWHTTYNIDTKENPSDILTKNLPAGEAR